MKSIKSIIKANQPRQIEKIPQYPVPEITKQRYDALKNVILQAHLSCAQPVPEPDFINALIISWNAALRRIPTPYLEPALQHAIEIHNGIGKITSSIIIRAFRDLLMQHKNSQSYELPGPRTAPPKEYYDILAKLGFYPKVETAPSKTLKKLRPQYKIEKRTGRCQDCTAEVKILVTYQDKSTCLDCAIRAEIIKKDSP